MVEITEAAGGVLWRPVEGTQPVEVALVHRPKYDDWSLPKGKLEPGEHPVLGALREIHEETGYCATPGRALGERRYLKDGVPKRVQYWAMLAGGGAFAPSAEVDQVMWLPPREAARHLAPSRDHGILRRFTTDPSATWPVLVVRHGSAGERSTWRGDDRDRPLDELGHIQSRELVPLLSAYGITRVLSADVLRCTETVGPFAKARGVAVESEPLLSETGYAAHPTASVERMWEIVTAGVPTAVCSQGRTIPGLLAALERRLGHRPPGDLSARKAGAWVLHAADRARPRLASLDWLKPPA